MPEATPAATTHETDLIDEAPSGTLDSLPNSSAATEGVLDAALAEAGFDKNGLPIEAADIPEKKVDAAPTPEKKADDAAPPVVEGEQKVEPVKPAADEFDKIELPAHTKPKTVESFDKVKSMARERVSAVEKERDELKTKLEAAEKNAGTGATAEEKKELLELRAFRSKVDVEADPAWKDFDVRAKANVDMIFSKLKASGFTEDSIKKIQELGGPGEVDWDTLAAGGKITPQLKRYIEGKLFENEDLTEKKKHAVEAAKSNADEYLKTRQAEFAKQGSQSREEVQKKWSDDVRPKLTWLSVQEIKPTMKPEEKALAEAHNKLVAEVEADLKDALADGSAETQALLVASYAVSKKVRFEYDLLKTASDSRIKSLEKELSDAKNMLSRIKKSSTSRLASSAPDKVEASNKSGGQSADRGDQLDALLQQTLAEQSAEGR